MSDKKKFNKSLVTGIVIGASAVIVVNVGMNSVSATTSNVDEYNKKLNTIQNMIDEYYIFDYEKTNLDEGLFKGYMYGLDDPYSAYFSAEDYKSFMDDTTGEYVGIGAVVTTDPTTRLITVVQPFEDGPAYTAGIRSGDAIISIDGIDVTAEELEKAVSMMKGEKGTEVTVKVLQKSTNKTKDFKIIRDEVEIDTINAEVLDDNIGYIQITGFDSVTLSQFNEEYDKLLQEGVEGLIIDVRNNPGGSLDVVANIADRLVPEGLIVYTEDKQGNREEIKSDAEQIDIPLVMLVNENSASASEVLAGAVKDHEVGKLVGEKTFGKGIVQQIFPLKDGSAVKLTIAEYFTPSGFAPHKKGIEPDVVVDVSDDVANNLTTLPHDKDEQLKKGIETIKNWK